MFTVRRTDIFIDWLTSLEDRRAAARIAARILRLENGILGDVKPVGEGVSELRINYGPVTGSTSRKLEGRSFSSSAVEIRVPRRAISRRQRSSPKRGRSEDPWL